MIEPVQPVNRRVKVDGAIPFTYVEGMTKPRLGLCHLLSTNWGYPCGGGLLFGRPWGKLAGAPQGMRE